MDLNPLHGDYSAKDATDGFRTEQFCILDPSPYLDTPSNQDNIETNTNYDGRGVWTFNDYSLRSGNQVVVGDVSGRVMRTIRLLSLG